MIIDGKQLAAAILEDCKKEVLQHQLNGITPTMAVILVGDDPASSSYVKQKEKAAERIGAKLRIKKFELGIEKNDIQSAIQQLNNDNTVHGIIIQRPLPTHLQDPALLNSILPSKDIDGFVAHTPFDVPVAKAVNKILQKTYETQHLKYDDKEYYQWVMTQQIVVIGRGETAGKPVAQYLTMRKAKCTVITSQTKDPSDITKTADIIISCVGKEKIIKKESIKKGVILISVGIWRDSNGKLHGDYEEDDIKDIASFYTPTPGGVGPVNVACLMENLVQATAEEVRSKK